MKTEFYGLVTYDSEIAYIQNGKHYPTHQYAGYQGIISGFITDEDDTQIYVKEKECAHLGFKGNWKRVYRAYV